ncbi:ArsC/Spx/MgsR family protein [Austwickia chelonae]|uniref:ArsC/Spx/MgsR family protein n=1 Tax=Austwickia chelonae TaxID=100225 RepID=UPI000E235B1C|nr:ArsC/Spx/MgsR family protein [Austwickia chelonae]
MTEIRMFHNTHCSKSRAALETLQDKGLDAQIVDYTKVPLTRVQLIELLGKLEDPPSALVRRDEAFAKAGLTDADVQTVDQVATVLADHPGLMERPVLVRGDRAVIGRPAERVSAFLSEE